METTGGAKHARGDGSAPWLDTLPLEVLSTLRGFLLGYDLFKLTHVSPRLRDFVNAKGDDLWRFRLIDDYSADENESQRASTTKEKMVRDRSLWFRGTQKHPSFEDDRRSCVCISGFDIADRSCWLLSFDTWFSRLPADQDTCAGGILCGAQSTVFDDTMWPSYHQPFLHFDSDLRFYCSVMDKKEPLVKLQAYRWYHLALVFHRQAAS